MKSLQVKQVDAFTKKSGCGNPAGVVVDARGLSDDDMQSIAKEMNLSETAFIVPATRKGADLRLRWFTPTDEVDLCGHATIASFHALAESGLYGMQKEGRYRFTVETRSGLLGILVDKTSRGGSVEFELPLPRFTDVGPVSRQLLTILGLTMDDIRTDIPTVTDAYAYVPLRSLQRLHALTPSYRDLEAALKTMNVGGLCLFTLETIEPTSAVHSRFFAPGLGVDEDPVTGSANGPLGVYIDIYVRPTLTVAFEELTDGRIEYMGEQGDVMNRPGRVAIRLAREEEAVRRLWIAGRAVTVTDAMLRLSEKD